MIAQLLNREFVLQQMGEIREDLAGAPDDRRSGPAPPVEVEPDDYREALAELDRALAREAAASSGPRVVEGPADDRRGPEPAPLDDFAFISHDPIVSLFQSSLEMYLLSNKSGDHQVDEDEPADDRRAGDEPPVVTDRSLAGVEPNRADGRRVFDKFSITDARWVSSVFAMGVRKFRKRREFPAERPRVTPLSPNARVVLVGDWGSGVPRAQKVATQMRVSIDQARAEGRECHVIHLGDVYYSGFEYEYQNRFLKYWPVEKGEADSIGSWCLNGNHDMYAGGYAYFDFLLKERRFNHWQGQLSTFHLQNDTWQILGLDTAWDDNGLKDPQAEWVRHRLQSDPDRKVMFLSHHQLFSAHEQTSKVGAVLKDKLGDHFTNPRVRAWFWGHEHRCDVYQEHMGVAHAACIGHGGIPYYMNLPADEAPRQPSKYEYRESIDRGLEHWGYMGYTVLDFAGDSIQATYIDENGMPHYSDRIR